ncbi:MAG: DUF481 domain-containing protein [Ghiorsea sp.]
MKNLSVLIVVLFGFMSVSFANEWGGNAELGFVQTNGNTDTSSLNVKGKGIQDGEEWRTTVDLGALKSTDTGATTSEKYNASVQEDWKLIGSGYLFGRIGYEQDKFGGFNSRTSETVGYGFDILKSDEKQWNAEVGIGARQIEDTAGAKTSDTVFRAATLFNWKISDTASFSQELKTEGGQEGYITNSVTALTNQVAGNLSSKISYSAQHNSEAPAGTEAIDSILAASLVFSY